MGDCRRINIISSNNTIRAIWNQTNSTYDLGIEPGTLGAGAPLDSPHFIGIPTAPTTPSNTNTNQLATTAFVQAAITAAVGTGVGVWGLITGTITNQLDLIAYLQANYTLNNSASALTTGTLPDARLSSNVVFKDTAQTLTNKTLTGPILVSPSGLVKADVGLSAVDNTPDLGKPISTATQAALDLKAASVHTHTQADVTNLVTDLAAKQATLVSGTNIKTINSATLLGSGNILVQAVLVSGTNIKTVNNNSLLGSGNIDLTGGGGGTGDVVGPSSSLDNALPRFDGTLGKTIQGSGIIVDDSDNINIPGTITNTALTTALGLKAPLAGPTFTGTVVLPSTTSIGSVSNTELSYLDGVTSAIQTQFSGKAASVHTHAQADITNLVSDLAAKAALASPTFTGTPTLPTGTIAVTQSPADNSTKIATTAYVDALGALKANLAGPTFTGTVVLPSTTSIGTVSNTEISYLDGVTSALQTQIDSKQATLVSGTNIKTINSVTVLGSGNIVVGTGDVVGPASATDNALCRFDGTTGKLVQNSGTTLSDAGLLTVASVNITGLTGSGVRVLTVDGSNNVAAVETLDLDQSSSFIKGAQELGSPLKAETLIIPYYLADGGTALVDGRVNYVAIRIDKAQTITGAVYQVITAGVYTGTGLNNQIGLFTYSGGTLTQVAITANDDTLWKGTTGVPRQKAFVTPYVAAEGMYFLGFIWDNDAVATPAPTAPTIFSRSVNANRNPSLLFTNNAKVGMYQAAAALPSSVSASALTSTTNNYWMGVY